MLDETLDRLIYDVIEETILDIEELSAKVSYPHNSEWIMKSHSNGIVSGIEICQRILEIVDDSVEVKVINGDGMVVEDGDIIAIFRGKTFVIAQLIVQIRTISERLSSIATYVSKCRSAVSNLEIKFYSHQGFTPLFRLFEEYAFQQSRGYILTQEFPYLTLIDFRLFHHITASIHKSKIAEKEIDHQRLFGVLVNTQEEFINAISTNCDMIVLCDFSVTQLKTIFNVDIPEYICLVRGNYTYEELVTINTLKPDGFLIESFQNLPSFHIKIEHTR